MDSVLTEKKEHRRRATKYLMLESHWENSGWRRQHGQTFLQLTDLIGFKIVALKMATKSVITCRQLLSLKWLW